MNPYGKPTAGERQFLFGCVGCLFFMLTALVCWGIVAGAVWLVWQLL